MSRPLATATTVDRAGMEAFVRPRHRHILVTHRRDGRPQLSPVAGGLADSRVLISSYPERAKVRNLRRDPRASVLVLSDEWDGAWIQVDGTAEVVDLPEAVEALVTYYRAIAGEHPDWQEYRQAMQAQGKCLIRITPERWGPVATGGFPARLADG